VASKGEEKNIKLTIAYDGTGYFGWQRQVDKQTIQGTIEETIEMMVRKPVSLIGAGRTDAGVHALHQVANFRGSSPITPAAFLRALNSLLPENILIKDAQYVPFDFHARYHAKSKVYEYRIHNERLQSPFLRNYAWHIPRPLDLQAMQECLEVIEGIHDFSYFCPAQDRKIDTVRNMIQARLKIQEGNLLIFDFEANGFLRHMVRNIMGTIVKVGLEEMSAARFAEILESKEREHRGAKAPPGGLYLKDVKY
jgi:tRNA pseudouridine38-40 synthase